jgi:hypothetical protein
MSCIKSQYRVYSFIKAAVSETSLHNNQDEGAVPDPAAVFSLTRFSGIY